MKASIVVPTRNRADVLGDCLSSLSRQTVLPDQYEIIIVDNGSTDSTPSVVETFINRHPKSRVRYIIEPVPGLLSGRHRGAHEASAPILSYVDDDTVAAPDWLGAVLHAFTEPSVHLVGGPSRGVFLDPLPAWMDAFVVRDQVGWHLGCLSLQDMGAAIMDIPAGRVWGCNFSIRRTSLFALGGFHPDLVPAAIQRFQGDGETGLSIKIEQVGWRARYHPRAAVGHIITPDRLSPEYMERRYFYQGVCDSYTSIRAQGTTEGIEPPSTPVIASPSNSLSPDESAKHAVQYRADVAYARGFGFHLDETRKDPMLLEWVLRKDYLTDWKYPVEPA